jgi:hypothetical protein
MAINEGNCKKRKCKHYKGFCNDSEPFNELEEYIFCDAFPNGIPDEIAYGDNKHLTPVKGDNGITYEK